MSRLQCKRHEPAACARTQGKERILEVKHRKEIRHRSHFVGDYSDARTNVTGIQAQQQGSGTVKSSSNPAFHVKLAQSRNSSAVVERVTRYILKCCFGGTATMCLFAHFAFYRTVGVPFFLRVRNQRVKNSQGVALFFQTLFGVLRVGDDTFPCDSRAQLSSICACASACARTNRSCPRLFFVYVFVFRSTLLSETLCFLVKATGSGRKPKLLSCIYCT